MKNIITILCSLMIIFSFFNCITAQFAPVDTSKTFLQKVNPNEIEVYRSKVPEKDFIEIGIVNASGGNNTNKLIESLKKQAAENGGDAIIDLEPYPGGMSATVIRFID